MHLFADLGAVQDVQSLGVRGHDPVLDPVVDHLHEMAGAVGTAVEVTPFSDGLGVPVATWRPRRGVDSRGERREYRIEALDDIVLAADHQAEAALQPEHAAAGADVDVVDALLGQLGGMADVVVVVRVAPVDDHIAGLEHLGEVCESTGS